MVLLSPGLQGVVGPCRDGTGRPGPARPGPARVGSLLLAGTRFVPLSL